MKGLSLFLRFVGVIQRRRWADHHECTRAVNDGERTNIVCLQ